MCLHEYTRKSTVTLLQLTVPEQGWYILDRPVFVHNLQSFTFRSHGVSVMASLMSN